VCLVSHICACVLYGATDANEPSWVKNLLGEEGVSSGDMGIERKWLAAFYWAFVTLTTVGYGDITPVSNNERIATCVVCFVGTVTLAITR
jgi:hypothetical protein